MVKEIVSEYKFSLGDLDGFSKETPIPEIIITVKDNGLCEEWLKGFIAHIDEFLGDYFAVKLETKNID